MYKFTTKEIKKIDVYMYVHAYMCMYISKYTYTYQDAYIYVYMPIYATVILTLFNKIAGKMAKMHFCYGSLRGQAQVRPIHKLDEACTNADDRMMLVQQCSGDRVMS